MSIIKEVYTCIGNPEKLRVIGKINEKIEEQIMPLLARVLNAGFVKSQNYICFKDGESMVTIYSDGHVGMTMIDNKEHAIKILSFIEEKLKYVKENTDKIKAKYTPMRINVVEIYNLLPKTNCGKCGEKTCMAFALKLGTGSKDITECKPLFLNGKYIKQRETLIGLLESMGIDVNL